MSNVKQSRRSAREAVLQALYAIEVGKETNAKALKDTLKRESRDHDAENFITQLFDVSLANREWCEDLSLIHISEPTRPY